MLDPDRYLNNHINILKTRYVEVCCQLGNLYTELHDAEIAERKAFNHAFYSAETTTVSGAERYARSESQTEWITVGDCKRDIITYECEQTMLLNLIAWNDGK